MAGGSLRDIAQGRTRTPGVVSRSFSSAGNSVRSYLGSSTHRRGVKEVGQLFGIGAHGIGRLFGPAMAGMAAYEGYQEGGLTGAIGGVAKEAALWYTLGAVAPIAGSLAAAGGIALAGGAFASWSSGVNPLKTFSRPYVKDYMKRHAKLELGAPVMDQFGTIASMRRRSIQAIQNSRVSGRSALGHEASLFHQVY